MEQTVFCVLQETTGGARQREIKNIRLRMNVGQAFFVVKETISLIKISLPEENFLALFCILIYEHNIAP
jgi:hypothetical protein